MFDISMMRLPVARRSPHGPGRNAANFSRLFAAPSAVANQCTSAIDHAGRCPLPEQERTPRRVRPGRPR